jgi:hypothetical protein
MSIRTALFAITYLAFNLTPAQNLFASEDAYLVPKTVYPGDNASLIYPLGTINVVEKNIVLTRSGLPHTDDIILKRAELDEKNNRLVINFTAFAVGIVKLPPFTIGSFYFDSLEVNISGILESELLSNSVLVLSPASGPLAAPGTIWFFIVMFIIILIVLITYIVLSANHFERFHKILLKIRRKYIYTSMKHNLRNLKARTEEGEIILELLSKETRSFISLYTNINCRSFTPKEFLTIELESQLCTQLSCFFQSCDNYRFSGVPASSGAILELINTASEITDIFALQSEKV